MGQHLKVQYALAPLGSAYISESRCRAKRRSSIYCLSPLMRKAHTAPLGAGTEDKKARIAP